MAPTGERTAGGASVAAFALLLLLSMPALAATTYPGAAGAPLFLACAVAYLTRRRAIGGWLFYFYLQLYVGLPLAALGVIGNGGWRGLAPSAWESTREYLLFSIATVPLYLTYVLQGFVATVALFHRDAPHVRNVRWATLAWAGAAVTSFGIDLIWFPENLPVDIISTANATIWCLYFFRSSRVRWVLEENRWNYVDFANRSGVPTATEIKQANRKGWIAAAITLVTITALIGVVDTTDGRGLIAGAFVGVFWAAVVGLLVQHLSKRPKAKDARKAEASAEQQPIPATQSADNGHADKRGLNIKQKWVLSVAALLATTALLFPPFVIQHPSSGATYNGGYLFLFAQLAAVVNTGLLALELVVIVLLATVGVLLTKGR